MMEPDLKEIFKQGFIQAVFSKPLDKERAAKMTFHPLTIKGRQRIQLTRFSKGKALHRNVGHDDAFLVFTEYLEAFKEVHLYTENRDYLGMKTKAGTWRWIASKPTKTKPQGIHNRRKNYLLAEKPHAHFWKALGIANASGEIKPDKQAKFRQVNRFIEIIADIVPFLPADQALHIVDFGCGKAYLSFALYHYLVHELKRKVKMIGVDLKEDVVLHLEELRKELEFDSLHFYKGQIQTFALPKQQLDLVVSLHACDTATDDVINRALELEAKVILAVPCCQHAFYSKIRQERLDPLLKHGVLKERFAALATDAARAAYLEEAGYQVKVIEFIDTEHTPKNIMLKAVKHERRPERPTNSHYQDFLSYLGLIKSFV